MYFATITIKNLYLILTLKTIDFHRDFCSTINVERGKGNRVVRVPWRRNPSQSQQNLNLTLHHKRDIMNTQQRKENLTNQKGISL